MTIYFHTTEDVVFRAYYPYDENGGTLIATTDGEAQKNQPKIDFLYATGATANTRRPEVNFTDDTDTGDKDCSFHHCMSQITLTFEAGDGVDFSQVKPEGYELGTVKLTGTFNTADGTAAADEEEKSGTLEMNLADGTLTSSVILFPQTVTALPLFVKYNGERYKATLNIPEGALKAGNNYTWTVTVSNRGLSIGTAGISPWNPVFGDNVDADL